MSEEKKPVQADELLKSLDVMLNRPAAEAPSAEAPQAAPAAKSAPAPQEPSAEAPAAAKAAPKVEIHFGDTGRISLEEVGEGEAVLQSLSEGMESAGRAEAEPEEKAGDRMHPEEWNSEKFTTFFSQSVVNAPDWEEDDAPPKDGLFARLWARLFGGAKKQPQAAPKKAAAPKAAAKKPAGPAPATPEEELPDETAQIDLALLRRIEAQEGEAPAPKAQPVGQETGDFSLAFDTGSFEAVKEDKAREQALKAQPAAPAAAEMAPEAAPKEPPAQAEEPAAPEAPAQAPAQPAAPAAAEMAPEAAPKEPPAQAEEPAAPEAAPQPVQTKEFETPQQAPAVTDETGETTLDYEDLGIRGGEPVEAWEQQPGDTLGLRIKALGQKALHGLTAPQETAGHPFEEEELSPVEPEVQLMHTTVGLVVSAVLTVALIGLGFMAEGALPPITAVDPSYAPLPFLVVNLVLLLGVCAACFGALKSGLLALARGGNENSLSALAVLGAVLQLLVTLATAQAYQPLGVTVSASAAALLLTVGAASRMAAARMAIKKENGLATGEKYAAYVLHDQHLSEQLAQGLHEPEPQLLLSRPVGETKPAALALPQQENGLLRAMTVGVPAVALVCLGLSLVAGHSLQEAVAVFALVLCFAAPLAALFDVTVPLYLARRNASQAGAQIESWPAVQSLDGVNAVVVRNQDLFPRQCPRILGIKPFCNERIDMAILYATSIVLEGCPSLAGVFREMIEGRTEILFPVKDLTERRGAGFTAWCDNCRVMLGSRALMEQEDVGLPALDSEHRYTENGKYQALYLAVSGELYAMFVLQYRGSRRVARRLSALSAKGISLLVDSDDPTMTAQRIAEIYQLPAQSVKVLNAREAEAVAPALCYLPQGESCMTHQGSFESFADGLQVVAQAVRGQRTARLVTFAGCLLALLVGLLLSLAGTMATFSLPLLLFYQLAWCALSLASNLLHRP